MPSILEPDFDRLANRLKDGDEGAAGKIFDRFAPKIFGYLLAKTANRHVAEDLTQEVFLRVLSRIETFDPLRGSFSCWLWGVAKNALTDYWRDARTTPMSDLADAEGNLPDFPEERRLSPENELLAKEAWEIIRTFSADEQEVLVLHYVSGLRYKEISEATGKSEGSLRVLIHRLHKKIRENLE